MGAETVIFLVILALIVAGSVVASAVHKRRNLDLPAREPDRDLPPAPRDEPQPGHVSRGFGFGSGGDLGPFRPGDPPPRAK
jgi:hypothetical protein